MSKSAQNLSEPDLPNTSLAAFQPGYKSVQGVSAPGWLEHARQCAYDRIKKFGYPRRGMEYWKFTDPKQLVEISSDLKQIPEPSIGSGGAARLVDSDLANSSEDKSFDPQTLFLDLDRLYVSYVNGSLNSSSSDAFALENADICDLVSASRNSNSWVSQVYGTLESKVHSRFPRILAAANTAVCRTGLCILATGRTNKPVELNYSSDPDSGTAFYHHTIRVEKNAELTLLETGSSGTAMNKIIEVEVEDGASFHHIQVQGRRADRRAVTYLFARVGRESKLKSFTLCVNGELTRNECVVDLCGDEGSAHIAGAAVGDAAFHHDDTVFVTHDALNCESRQVFKKVLRNGAVGVFQGKILVMPGAQKTDGYQKSQGLLLDEKCQFLVKPELEIYADDVACSHGSTSGSVDPDALFYLRSRGISCDKARDILALAFLQEALGEIDDQRISSTLDTLLRNWLSRHR